MLFLNVADVVFKCCGILLHVARNMSWCCDMIFFYVVMLQKYILMLRVLFLNVANFSLHYVACNMVWCCDRILFLLFFFNATVDLTSAIVHLTSTVDLTALHPSRRPGASNAETRLHLQWQHNTVQAPLSCSCRSHEETKESNWHFGTKQ
jgi:hypothetical protein